MISVMFEWRGLRCFANVGESAMDGAQVDFDSLFVRDANGAEHDALFLLASPELAEDLREEAGLAVDQLTPED
jgi:hypothetical protein